MISTTAGGKINKPANECCGGRLFLCYGLALLPRLTRVELRRPAASCSTVAAAAVVVHLLEVSCENTVIYFV